MSKLRIVFQGVLLLVVFVTAQDSILLKDNETPIGNMADYTPPTVAANAGYYYPANYRVLNCWECFLAKGKMCIDSSGKSLFTHTQSSVRGNGFCCKQDYNQEYCANGAVYSDPSKEEIQMTCSSPSYVNTTATPDSEWNPVLTSDRNYRMFAFCPGVNENRCGVPGVFDANTPVNHTLGAKVNRTTLNATNIRYRPQAPPSVGSQDAHYDACYYEIKVDGAFQESYTPSFVKIKILKKENIQAYIYETSSRGDMGKAGIAGNLQVLEGDTYQVDPKVGFLIVFYNTGDTNGNFTFDYWAEGTKKDTLDEEADKLVDKLKDIEGDLFKSLREMNATETLVFHIACLILAVLLVICCCMCITCKYQLRKLENNIKEKELELKELDQSQLPLTAPGSMIDPSQVQVQFPPNPAAPAQVQGPVPNTPMFQPPVGQTGALPPPQRSQTIVQPGPPQPAMAQPPIQRSSTIVSPQANAPPPIPMFAPPGQNAQPPAGGGQVPQIPMFAPPGQNAQPPAAGGQVPMFVPPGQNGQPGGSIPMFVPPQPNVGANPGPQPGTPIDLTKPIPNPFIGK